MCIMANTSSYDDAEPIYWMARKVPGQNTHGGLRTREPITAPTPLRRRGEDLSDGYFVPLTWVAPFLRYLREKSKFYSFPHLDHSKVRHFEVKDPDTLFGAYGKDDVIHMISNEGIETERSFAPDLKVLVSGTKIGKIKDLKGKGLIRTRIIDAPIGPQTRSHSTTDSPDWIVRGEDGQIADEKQQAILFSRNFYSMVANITACAQEDNAATLSETRNHIALPLDVSRKLFAKIYPGLSEDDIFERISTRNMATRGSAILSELETIGKMGRVMRLRSDSTTGAEKGDLYDIWPGYVAEFLKFSGEGIIDDIDEKALEDGIDYGLNTRSIIRTDFKSVTDITIWPEGEKVKRSSHEPLPVGMAKIISLSLEHLHRTNEAVLIAGDKFKVVDITKHRETPIGRGHFVFENDTSDVRFHFNPKGQAKNFSVAGANTDPKMEIAVASVDRVILRVNGSAFHLQRH